MPLSNIFQLSYFLRLEEICRGFNFLMRYKLPSSKTFLEIWEYITKCIRKLSIILFWKLLQNECLTNPLYLVFLFPVQVRSTYLCLQQLFLLLRLSYVFLCCVGGSAYDFYNDQNNYTPSVIDSIMSRTSASLPVHS